MIYLMALILVIIAFIAFATYGMLDGSKDEEWYPVSVIVENSSSDRFTSFREGLERGAEDYHIRLNVVSTGAFPVLRKSTRSFTGRSIMEQRA